jgi:hypothetical protein
MDLSFDIRGHLIPHDLIDADWDTFVQNFILPFSENSTRHSIVSEFEHFVNEIKNRLKNDFEIWINGSFTTIKENPKDIDVVFHVPYQDVSDDLKTFISTNQKNKESKIDAYLVEIFPINHKNYVFCDTDTKYWLSQFGTTAPNRRKERFSKGIIKMIIRHG